MQAYIDYSAEVQKALLDNKPILALESTLLTHGLPFPHNVELAKTIEEDVRKHKVVPAIIALMKGKIKIGLNHHELETLIHDANIIKASRRDIAFVLSQGLNAGTTVSATLFCAHLASIKVFATGGIGGVHRGDTQDISADLIELARTPIAVICAGAKAILDLPKTLELLETLSIPVIGYQTTTFPAFYTATTSYLLSTHITDIYALGYLLKTHFSLKMSSGCLIGNPIPSQDEIKKEVIEPIITKALKTAEQQHITGKAITPFLLKEIAHHTEGKSLKANISLIKNNVELGAKLAAL